jgi:uncharacterized protein (DUF433 family)
MASAIVDERIAGTRITVHDVYYYFVNGRGPDETADILGITLDQVRAASEYINAHQPEVAAIHERIEQRNARGNPAEVEARRQATRARMKLWSKKRRQPAPRGRA